MSKGTRIKCDTCGFNFNDSKIKIKKQKVKDDIEQTYFRCPKCGKKYVILTTDTTIRKLIRRQKEMYPAEFTKDLTNKEYAEKVHEYNARKEEIKSRSRELTKVIE